jgi:hypothetical protein
MLCLILSPSVVCAQWQLNITQDEMTDEQIAVFRTVSLTHTANAIRMATKPILLIRCRGGEVTDAYVAVNIYVADMLGDVQLRFDKGTPFEEVWSTSNTNEALFSPNPSKFLDSLFAHKRFVFRYYPYRESPQTATFAIPSWTSQKSNAIKFCGFDPVARQAEIAEQQRAADKRAAEEAEHRRLDSLDLIKIATIRLSPPDGVIEITPTDTVLGKSLVATVVNRKGEVLSNYKLSFVIQYPDGKSLPFSGERLPLKSGTNVVQVFVNGTRADRDLQFEVR